MNSGLFSAVVRLSEFLNILSQLQYIDGIEEIPLSASRRKAQEDLYTECK